MSAADRRLPVPGLANARDLGGLPRARGGTTPTGVFLRSERPDAVASDGWATLPGLGAVLDLRQPEERAAHRSSLPAGVADLHVDLDGLADHPAFWADYWDNGLAGTPVWYRPHLDAMPERAVAALSALAAAPPGAVLLHCAGGRDRTGMISAILLHVAGVEPDAIVADYLQTVGNADALAAAQGRENPEPAIAELLADRGTTSEAAFRAFLDGLDVQPLLAALPPAEATAIRTWRGTLEPAD